MAFIDMLLNNSFVYTTMTAWMLLIGDTIQRK
jgi:hypothetical protein